MRKDLAILLSKSVMKCLINRLIELLSLLCVFPSSLKIRREKDGNIL